MTSRHICIIISMGNWYYHASISSGASLSKYSVLTAIGGSTIEIFEKTASKKGLKTNAKTIFLFLKMVHFYKNDLVGRPSKPFLHKPNTQKPDAKTVPSCKLGVLGRIIRGRFNAGSVPFPTSSHHAIIFLPPRWAQPFARPL